MGRSPGVYFPQLRGHAPSNCRIPDRHITGGNRSAGAGSGGCTRSADAACHGGCGERDQVRGWDKPVAGGVSRRAELQCGARRRRRNARHLRRKATAPPTPPRPLLPAPAPQSAPRRRRWVSGANSPFRPLVQGHTHSGARRQTREARWRRRARVGGRCGALL